MLILKCIYHWSPLALLQLTIVGFIMNSWTMVKKITSNISKALDLALNVVHQSIDITTKSTINYLLTKLPDTTSENDAIQCHRINKPSRRGHRLKLGSLTILIRPRAVSTCSAMTSINVFPTPLSNQMNPMQLDA